jgi:transposase
MTKSGILHSERGEPILTFVEASSQPCRGTGRPWPWANRESNRITDAECCGCWIWIIQQLAAVRRLAHEAADSGLLSPELAAGIGRGYDAEAIRQGLRGRHIIPFLAKRNTEHGSGLGRWRWIVERTFAWLNQFRRLRVRYEKRADIHEAFLFLGCALICWRYLQVNWKPG